MEAVRTRQIAVKKPAPARSGEGSARDAAHGAAPGEPSDRPLAPRVRLAFEGGVFVTFSALFAFAALALQENLVFLMGCVAFAAAQGARWPARRNLRGLIVRREAPIRARAGVETPITYVVANPRGLAAAGVEIRDRPGPRARPVSLALEVPGIPAGGSVRKTTRMTFLRRGLIRLGGIQATSRFPLGFFRAEARLALEHVVLVRPREGRPTMRLRDYLGGRADARRRPSLTVRGDDALHGVREFRDGDDPRRIHWRTTARRGRLALTQWRREQGRSLVLILGRGHGAGKTASDAFERAVSVAATVWRAAQREGLETHLELGGGRGAVRRGAGGIRRLGQGLDALARVRPQAGRRPRAALRRMASRARGGRVVVYIASGPEPGIRRRLAAAVGREGTSLYLRTDQPEVAKWVRGLQ